MRYNNKIDVFEGIDVRQDNCIKKVYYLSLSVFLDKGFRFQSTVCSDCQDVVMTSIDINSIAIVNIHDVDYHCIIFGISKNKVMYILKDYDLSGKIRSLQDRKHLIYFLSYHQNE